MEAVISNWSLVEVQGQNEQEKVSWYHYPGYHEHSLVQDFPAYHSSNQESKDKQMENAKFLIPFMNYFGLLASWHIS